MELGFTDLIGAFLATTIMIAWSVWRRWDCGIGAPPDAGKNAAFIVSGVLLILFGLPTIVARNFSGVRPETDFSEGFLGVGAVLLVAGFRVFVQRRVA